MPYYLKRKTKYGEKRVQARVFAGVDDDGRRITLVRTLATKEAAQRWTRDELMKRDRAHS